MQLSLICLVFGKNMFRNLHNSAQNLRIRTLCQPPKSACSRYKFLPPHHKARKLLTDFYYQFWLAFVFLQEDLASWLTLYMDPLWNPFNFSPKSFPSYKHRTFLPCNHCSLQTQDYSGSEALNPSTSI